MRPALIIEMCSINRTLILEGYAKHWQSSVQQTVCSALECKVNQDGSIDINAEFESNGGVEIACINMPLVIVWA